MSTQKAVASNDQVNIPFLFMQHCQWDKDFGYNYNSNGFERDTRDIARVWRALFTPYRFIVFAIYSPPTETLDGEKALYRRGETTTYS
jgi:hypothetical protein